MTQKPGKTYICNIPTTKLRNGLCYCAYYLHKTSIMKRLYIKVLISAGLFAFAGNSLSAQTNPSRPSMDVLGKGNLKPDSANTFISFSPVLLEGKTYVRWLVKNDRKDGVFIVERSGDGVDFEALGFRDRVGTQLQVNLFYSFVDEEPLSGVNHYRVMQVGADNTFRYSPVVKVRNDAQPGQSGSASEQPLEKN